MIYKAYDSWQGARTTSGHDQQRHVGAFGNMIEILDYGKCDPNAVSPEGYRVIRGEAIPYPLQREGGPEAGRSDPS
jgi:hypothetical protein